MTNLPVSHSKQKCVKCLQAENKALKQQIIDNKREIDTQAIIKEINQGKQKKANTPAQYHACNAVGQPTSLFEELEKIKK